METNTGDLPRVEGLDALVKDAMMDKGAEETQAAQQQVQTPVDDGQVDAELEGVLKNFTNPDGKVRTKDLLKSYKEIQGYTTKVSQENAQFKEELARLKEQLELRQYQQPVAPVQQQPVDWQQMFIENPEQAIAVKAAEMANVQRIQEVLQEEQMAKPNEFNERLAYVRSMSQNPQLAHLANSPKGVRKLFEIADKSRAQNLERTAREAMKVIFGEEVDVDKMRQFLKSNNVQTPNPQPSNLNLNAYMPNTGTSTRTGADINATMNDIQRVKTEAVKNGDVSAVARATLLEVLNK